MRGDAPLPDADCIAHAMQRLDVVVRGLAAAGCSESEIGARIVSRLADHGCLPPDPEPPELRHDDAAWAIAHHCAAIDWPWRAAIAEVVRFAAVVPGGVDDHEHVAAIVRAAYAAYRDIARER